MPHQTTMLHVRLTKEEKEAFKRLADFVGEKRARLLRKMIREAVNQVPDLLHDEHSLFVFALRQLVGIAHNLNQITAAMHRGKMNSTVDVQYLVQIQNYVSNVKDAFEIFIKKNKNRWVSTNEIR